MPTTHPAATLTEAEAIAAYRAVCTTLDRVYGDVAAADHPVRQGDDDPAWLAGPVLVRDFDLYGTPRAWAVVWETGPYFWADYVPAGGREPEFGLIYPPTVLPAGVHAET